MAPSESERNARVPSAPPLPPRARLEFYLRDVLLPTIPSLTAQMRSDSVRGAVWFVFDYESHDATPVATVSSSTTTGTTKRGHIRTRDASDTELFDHAAVLKAVTEQNARLAAQLRGLQDHVEGADEQYDALQQMLIAVERDAVEAVAECELLRVERDQLKEAHDLLLVQHEHEPLGDNGQQELPNAVEREDRNTEDDQPDELTRLHAKLVRAKVKRKAAERKIRVLSSTVETLARTVTELQ